MKPKVGILISGRGSNMAALMLAAKAADYPAEIALVLSNDPKAEGLAIAAAAGVPTAAIDHKLYRRDRAAHEMAIVHRLDAAGVEIVCLAGYMRLLTPLLVGRYAGRMLNIHPSLLPSFPGLHSHERALAAGVKLHGCTVHLVTEVMDEGPILAQAAVPVLESDTEDSLAARVLVQEHRLYPAALAAFARGGIADAADPSAALCNPLPALATAAT
jgi:formyltetrahydrofolate-dependent phosphoribosylglycinamide formyltransferase